MGESTIDQPISNKAAGNGRAGQQSKQEEAGSTLRTFKETASCGDETESEDIMVRIVNAWGL